MMSTYLQELANYISHESMIHSKEIMNSAQQTLANSKSDLALAQVIKKLLPVIEVALIAMILQILNTLVGSAKNMISMLEMSLGIPVHTAVPDPTDLHLTRSQFEDKNNSADAQAIKSYLLKALADANSSDQKSDVSATQPHSLNDISRHIVAV